MNALSKEVRLPAHLDRLTDPDLDLRRVRGIVRVGAEEMFVALGGRGRDCFYRLSIDGSALKPMGLFASVDGLYPGDDTGAMVLSEGAIWRVDLNGKKGRVLVLPDGMIACDVKWGAHGVVVCALVDRRKGPGQRSPVIYPKNRGQVVLCRYTSVEGWQDLVQVPEGCGGLSASANGRRMAWREPVNAVQEEAQRAEFCGFDLSDGAVRRLTEGAGKARRVLMALDGASLLYEANHERERPITTHTDLWWMRWDGSERMNLTEGGRCIDRFGWGADEKAVWVSFVEGLSLSTEVLALDGTPEGTFADLDASADIAWMPDGLPVFETENMEKFPAIWTGTRRVPLPQPENYEDLQVLDVAWEAPDGLAIEGVLYEAEGVRKNAPLLVNAHGGPAAPVENIRSEAVRHRHLLRAGYRVFRPAFRGSLGFGDAFAQANIGCQGNDDLSDIISGVDFLVEEGLADPNHVGIFGGSYGGYMTLRAMAMTDRFCAGAALYGFIDNRRMSLETGDVTYETEYVAPLSWPLTEAVRRSDVFPHLGKISAPLLLLHGQDDPVCPLSESKVVCQALLQMGVPTGLVAYPGEGHGFRKKRNRRDCARRMLAWFLTYLAP